VAVVAVAQVLSLTLTQVFMVLAAVVVAVLILVGWLSVLFLELLLQGQSVLAELVEQWLECIKTVLQEVLEEQQLSVV
jgi:hypothetical protein